MFYKLVSQALLKSTSSLECATWLRPKCFVDYKSSDWLLNSWHSGSVLYALWLLEDIHTYTYTYIHIHTPTVEPPYPYALAQLGNRWSVSGEIQCEAHTEVLRRITTPFFGEMLHPLFDRCGEGFIQQQDNEPKCTSPIWQNYFKTKEDQGVLNVLDFPTQAPDLNPTAIGAPEAEHSMTSQDASTSWWDSRFYRNLRGPCHRQWMLSLKQKGDIQNIGIFCNSQTFFKLSFQSNC